MECKEFLKEMYHLNCNKGDNKKYLEDIFNELPDVKSKGYTFKDTFKDDLNKFIKFQNDMLTKYGFHKLGISYREKSQSVFVQSDKIEWLHANIYSKSLEELYMKICIFVCYEEARVSIINPEEIVIEKKVKKKKKKLDKD